jgi:hypothetical protein
VCQPTFSAPLILMEIESSLGVRLPLEDEEASAPIWAQSSATCSTSLGALAKWSGASKRQIWTLAAERGSVRPEQRGVELFFKVENHGSTCVEAEWPENAVVSLAQLPELWP